MTVNRTVNSSDKFYNVECIIKTGMSKEYVQILRKLGSSSQNTAMPFHLIGVNILGEPVERCGEVVRGGRIQLRLWFARRCYVSGPGD